MTLLKYIGAIFWRVIRIIGATPLAIGICITIVAVRFHPSLERLLPQYSACRVLHKEDNRYSRAWFGESMLSVARIQRWLGLPTAICICLLSILLSWVSGSSLFLIGGSLFALVMWMVMETTSPGIPIDSDFRSPILVLRSGTNRELVESYDISPDEFSVGGRTSLLWSLGNDLWDWPRLVFFLNEETLNNDGVFGIQLRSDDESWEAALKKVVDVAWFVIVIPGVSPSCVKELRMLSEWEVLDKVIVMMPPDSCSVHARDAWEATRTHLQRLGFAFPEHEVRGLFYLPNVDFSPVSSISIGELNWTRMEPLLPNFRCLDRSLATSLPRPYYENQQWRE